MKRNLAVFAMPLLTLSGTALAQPEPIKPACQPVFAAKGKATEEQLEACLPEHSPLFGFVGLTGVFPEGGGVVAQVGSNPFGPLYTGSRVRATNAALHLDLEAGLVISSHRRLVLETMNLNTIKQTTEAVSRSQWLLSGGLLLIHPFAKDARMHDHKGVQAGIQWHAFNDLGAYDVFQLHGIRTLGEDAAWGSSASFQGQLWFAPKFSWGSELGFIFANSTDMWLTLDLAYSFGS